MSMTDAQLANIEETARLNPSKQWVGQPLIDSDTDSASDDSASDDSASDDSASDDSASDDSASSDDETATDNDTTSDYIGYYLLILTTGYCTLLIALFITNNENILYSPPAIIFIIMFGSMLIKLVYALWAPRKYTHKPVA
jgi:hypothetical protein